MASIKHLQQEIRTALNDAFASVWSVATKYTAVAVRHCNDNNHSPDLLVFMADELRTHGNGGGVYFDCFVKAVELTTARKIKWDKEKQTHVTTFGRELWEKIKEEDFKFLAQLEKDGLGSFKDKRGPGSNSKKNSAVTKGAAAILAKDIAAEVEEIKKIDPDNAEVQAIIAELQAALTRLQDTKKALLAGQKIVGKLAPDNITSPDDEARKAELAEAAKAARKAELEAELAELEEVA